MTVKLPTNAVHPNPDQPRKRFDESELQALANSIITTGLLQPITVRLVAPDPSCLFGDDQKGGLSQYEIVAGERRWRAHVLAKLGTIDANIIEATVGERDILAIVENLQRTDITPLEEGRAYQRMIDAGYTPAELAHKLGLKQPRRITERMSLLRLNPSYLDLLEKGHLSPSQGFELARLGAADQDRVFAMINTGRCDTCVKLRVVVDGFLAAANQGSLWEIPQPSANETAILSAFERKMEQIVKLVDSGFKDNEIVVLRKINPHRASIVVTQIGLISKHLKLVEREIQKVVAQGELITH